MISPRGTTREINEKNYFENLSYTRNYLIQKKAREEE